MMQNLLTEKDFGMAFGSLEMSESGIRDYLEYPHFSAISASEREYLYVSIK